MTITFTADAGHTLADRWDFITKRGVELLSLDGGSCSARQLVDSNLEFVPTGCILIPPSSYALSASQIEEEERIWRRRRWQRRRRRPHNTGILSMKIIIITIALAAAPSFAASGDAVPILAMGTKGDTVHFRDNRTDERYSERDHKDNKSGADLSSTKNGVHSGKKSPPEKKPRLKFRDEPKCSC
jgi:hypothetical protein